MKIKEVIDKKVKGLHYNNRIILPFHAHFFKIVFDDEIYTDFSIHSKDIFIQEEGNFTNIYFRSFRNIDDEISKFESIKFVAVDKGEDIFSMKNHLKLSMIPEENHELLIEFAGEDTLLIE